MHHTTKLLIANAVLFQIGWFACIVGGNTIALICTPLIVIIHLRYLSSWKKEREILIVTLLLGAAIDSTLGHFGILIFQIKSLLIPPWLACLWLIFGTTIRHSLAWTAKHWWLGSIVGAVAGPASYYSGAKLAHVQLGAPIWQTLLILAIIWSILIPLLHSFSAAWLANYMRTCKASTNNR